MLNREEREKAEAILNQGLGNQVPSPDKKEEKQEEVKPKVEESKPKEEKVPEKSQEKIVIAGKEYTPEEAAERLNKLNELELIEKKHGNIREIYKEFTKRSQRLAELEKGNVEKNKIVEEKKETIEKIDAEIDKYDEEALKIRKDAQSKLGLATKEEVEAALKNIEEAKKELLGMKETFKQELQDLREFKEKKVEEEEKVQMKKTNEDLTRVEQEFPFVKRNDVIDYMIEESKKGNILTVDEAVKRKYTDEIIEFKIRKNSSNVPETDGSKGGKPVEGEVDNTVSFSNDHQNLFEKGMKVFEKSLNKLKL